MTIFHCFAVLAASVAAVTRSLAVDVGVAILGGSVPAPATARLSIPCHRGFIPTKGHSVHFFSTLLVQVEHTNAVVSMPKTTSILV